MQRLRVTEISLKKVFFRIRPFLKVILEWNWQNCHENCLFGWCRTCTEIFVEIGEGQVQNCHFISRFELELLFYHSWKNRRIKKKHTPFCRKWIDDAILQCFTSTSNCYFQNFEIRFRCLDIVKSDSRPNKKTAVPDSLRFRWKFLYMFYTTQIKKFYESFVSFIRD